MVTPKFNYQHYQTTDVLAYSHRRNNRHLESNITTKLIACGTVGFKRMVLNILVTFIWILKADLVIKFNTIDSWSENEKKEQVVLAVYV